MELELNKINLACYNMVLDTTAYQEETLETIVPDACPDIARIIDTQAILTLKHKEVTDGRVSITGSAKLTVLYVPDSGPGPCRLEVTVPVVASLEDQGIRHTATLTVAPRVKNAETRAINPRKVLVKVEAAFRTKIFVPEQHTLCSGVASPEAVPVEQLKVTQKLCAITCISEKSFSFADDLIIQASRPEAETLLGHRVECTCHESKIIGSKLIFKGDVTVHLRYRTQDCTVCSIDFTLPFSQISEVSGVGENCVHTFELALSGTDVELGGDKRTISVSLNILAQAVIYEEITTEILTDAYSPTCHTECEFIHFPYQTLSLHASGRENVREVIETGIGIRTVLDVWALPGILSGRREGNVLVLQANLCVSALCIAEDDTLCTVSRCFDVHHRVDLTEGEGSCGFCCRCGNPTAAPTAEGVEIYVPLEFPYLYMQRGESRVIGGLTVNETESPDQSQRPSVVLRVLGEKEQLWDVAKCYNTTIADIIKANELADEQPSCGTMLLIPKKR